MVHQVIGQLLQLVFRKGLFLVAQQQGFASIAPGQPVGQFYVSRISFQSLFEFFRKVYDRRISVGVKDLLPFGVTVLILGIPESRAILGITSQGQYSQPLGVLRIRFQQ